MILHHLQVTDTNTTHDHISPHSQPCATPCTYQLSHAGILAPYKLKVFSFIVRSHTALFSFCCHQLYQWHFIPLDVTNIP